MASSEGSDDFEWQPPTEAEMKILQAKRERSDKISKLMGDYLLKGYKMLGVCCTECGTILMQDRQKQNYCVACSELDSDTGKDDPALNHHAAQRQVAEEHERGLTPMDESPDMPLSSHPVAVAPPRDIPVSSCFSNPPLHSGRSCAPPTDRPTAIAPQQREPPANVIAYHQRVPPPQGRQESYSGLGDMRTDVATAIETVRRKLNWATQELAVSSSIDGSIQLCQLIKSCAETLASLYSMQKNTS